MGEIGLGAEEVEELVASALDEASDDHGGAGGYGGAAVGNDGGVGRGHGDVVVGEVEGFGGDLGQDGVGSLTEFGAGDEDADVVFRGDVDPGEGVEVAFAGAGEACAVEEAGDADAAFDGAEGIFAGELGAFDVVVGFVEGAGEEVVEDDGLAHDLAGGGGVAVVKEVSTAEFVWCDADGRGDLVHVALDGEDGLGRAESAKCSGGDGVGGPGAGADADVGAEVGTGGVEGGAGEHGGGQGGVCAGVGGDFDVHGEELAVLVDSGAMAGAGGMALGGGGEVFHAVVDDFDGPAGLEGKQAGVCGEDGGVILFAAECAAGFRLDDAHFLSRQGEDGSEGAVDVEGTLERAPDGEAVGV